MNAKICADCKHAVNDYSEWKCRAPQNLVLDIVSGKYTPRRTFCDHHRNEGPIFCRMSNTCGKEGRWFEFKQSAETTR